MTSRIRHYWSSRPARYLRIYVLFCVIASVLSISMGDLLLQDASAGQCSITGSSCTDDTQCNPMGAVPGDVCAAAPEMPLVMVPLFILMSTGSVYMIRRRQFSMRRVSVYAR